MRKVRDASKERYWRRLFRRGGKTGETIAEFCARQRVPVHQYYWWQRTLRERDGQASRATTGHRDAGRSIDASASKGERDPVAFVPVRLPFSVSAPIEVIHPGGCLVRIPVGFDPLSLGRILATLGRPACELAEQ